MNSIDWDNIPEGFDWVATDKDGDLYAYDGKPVCGNAFMWRAGEASHCKYIGTFERQDDWRESLQHRSPKEPEINFGPRPEKLWVGMKGKTPVWGVVTLIKNGEYFLTWDSEGLVFNTSVEDGMSVDSKKCNSIVEWEQPAVTCCDPEPEPDWKAKYEQLMEKHEMLEAKMEVLLRNYYEVSKKKDAATGVALYLRKDRDVVRKERDNLQLELKAAQAELNDVYKAQSKLNKIVRIVNELDEDDD